MGWQQLNTWTRMASPDTAVFITQAAPWSPSSNGVVSGQAIWMDVKKEEDLEKYKGKLAGKVVLLGEMREVKPVDKPLFEREDEKDLAKIVEHPLGPEPEFFTPELMKRFELRQKVSAFLATEHPLADDVAFEFRERRHHFFRDDAHQFVHIQRTPRTSAPAAGCPAGPTGTTPRKRIVEPFPWMASGSALNWSVGPLRVIVRRTGSSTQQGV